MFNDGVGIVAFAALLAVATGAGELNPVNAILEVVMQALGGLVIGIAAGWVVIRLMGTLDDFAVETSMSIALAMGVYAGAQALHLSGAIAAVGAGMLFGGKEAKAAAMAGETEAYIKNFWTLVDEILNALLFLLLGIELAVVHVPGPSIWPAIDRHSAGVLLARFVVVLPWGFYYRMRYQIQGATGVLGWGGLHGALSLALALSLPAGSGARTLILSVTYAVVAFSIARAGPNLHAAGAPDPSRGLE